VTGDLLAGVLERHGLHERDRQSKHALFESVSRAFRPYANNEPTHAWWIPGRIEVVGKHTDYCGGHSLVGTVPRGFAMLARARQDGVIRMLDARRLQTLTLDAAPVEAAPPCGGWRNYAQTVVRRLGRNFPDASIGADIVFASDLPSASGMSSSSALMIGLASVLVTLRDLQSRAEWTGNIRSPADAAGYFACVENGMSFGSLAGDAGVGTHGGSEDHLAIVCGVPGHLSAWTFVPIEHVGNVRVPDDWTFVIAVSGVEADKTGDARDAYNRLSREARALLDLWNRHEPLQPSLAAAMASDASAPSRLRELLSQERAPLAAAGDLDRRLAHLLREDARCADAIAAVRDADRDRLGAVSDASQQDAETLLRNQVPETTSLARAARASDAFAASSFGAGFGGSVWALVDRHEASSFADRWLAGYRQKFPARSGATTFVASVGPPLTRLI
jgi:galactokinase